MNNDQTCGPTCGCGPTRRDTLKMIGLGVAAAIGARLPKGAMAGPFDAADFDKLVPADKKLSPDWIKSLFERGAPTVYRGEELNYIGMPIGGITTGQLYLGGDGKLWHWDIFNHVEGTGAAHYAQPVKPASPLEQGFAIRIVSDGKTQTRTLDHRGFSDIGFLGQYPIGTVEYKDPASPVAVTLEAFSPFIPLNVDDSSLPATVLRYTVRNTSAALMEVTLAGWLQNAALLNNPWLDATRRNRIVPGKQMTFLNCTVEKSTAATLPRQPDVVFEDWNKETYDGWTVEGVAFGKGPAKRSDFPAYMGEIGGEGERVANSHVFAPGKDVGSKDAQTGKLTSQPFIVEHNFIKFWIGGGKHRGKTCINLIIDGKIVRSVTGANSNALSLQAFVVQEFIGKKSHLEIVDAQGGSWGNISVGRITFSDAPINGNLGEASDFGSMGLALLGEPPEHVLATGGTDAFTAPAGNVASSDASTPLQETLVGAIGRTMHLAPWQSATVDFVLTWHFKNLRIEGLADARRHYDARFDSAQAVAQYVTDNFDRLTSQTRLWRDTWYDSTLPHWFLDRTFLNACILATSTCFRFADGRFYSWEGVGCCPGTCTHVWHYAQTMARLFPELERITREHVDLGKGFNPDTGVMGFRAEFDRNLAVDGQAGTLLRCYREHQMSADDTFLKRNWPNIKKAYDPLLKLDGNDNGVLEGAQMNTLDTAWHGKVNWLSSLYLAACRAGEQMAREMGDSAFADRCHAIAERGSKNLVEQLFDGEYFYNKVDPNYLDAINSGTGCEVDQVFGQSWAFQVGLGRVLPEDETRNALRSLWRYNFSPDVGPYRQAHKPGRWYAMPGEAGLLMCTFPRADWDYDKAKGKGPDFASGYFNECMNGFEYQVAGHMIAEGMVREGFAVARAVHDRYHASRRNPWNEVECGDHYSRSMASYGLFITACGYEYHGPRGELSFAPRLTPEDFKAAFTTAEGWGSFSQKQQDDSLKVSVAIRRGRLRIKTLGLTMPMGIAAKTAKVSIAGKPVDAALVMEGSRARLALPEDVMLEAGQELNVFIHS